jgi:hypothetical protein
MQHVIVGIDGLVEKILSKGGLSDAELAAMVKDPRSGEAVTPTSIWRWRTGSHRPRQWALRILVKIAAKYGIEVKSTDRKTRRRTA